MIHPPGIILILLKEQPEYLVFAILTSIIFSTLLVAGISYFIKFKQRSKLAKLNSKYVSSRLTERKNKIL